MINAATTEMVEKITRLIESDPQAMEGRSGAKPLDMFALRLTGKLILDTASEDEIEAAYNALQVIADGLDQRDHKFVDALCDFIWMAKIPPHIIEEAFLPWLQKSDRLNPKLLEVRGEILQLLAQEGPGLSESFLENELGVRNFYPWYWIDAMSETNWDITVEEIAKHLKDDDGFDHLRVRLARFLHDQSPNKLLEAVETWQPLLSQENIEELRGWFTRSKIRMEG